MPMPGKSPRGPAAWARDPVPGMIVYGRTPSGTLGRFTVHFVGRGSVYGAYRMRGWPAGGHGRYLCRYSMADWLADLSRVIGVKMPRIEAPAPEDARP